MSPYVMDNLLLNKTLSMVTGVAALVASLSGVMNPSMYEAVVSERLRPGVFAQDLVAIAAATVILVLAIRWKSRQPGKTIGILGLLGFLFYAYGIYAIEQVYTPLYPLYLAVMGLSFYGLVTGLASLRRAELEQLEQPPALRIGAAIFGLVVAVMFSILWFAQLVPLLRTGDRIEYTFSIYVIDLVFVMPGFTIAAVMAIRRRALGLVGLPALFVVGIGILSPLTIAELLKPIHYDQPTDWEGFWLYGAVSVSFMVALTAYLARLKAPAR